MGVNPTDTGINIRGSEFSGDMVGRPADEWRQVQFDRVFPRRGTRGLRPVLRPTPRHLKISGLSPEDPRGTCKWLVNVKGTGTRF